MSGSFCHLSIVETIPTEAPFLSQDVFCPLSHPVPGQRHVQEESHGPRRRSGGRAPRGPGHPVTAPEGNTSCPQLPWSMLGRLRAYGLRGPRTSCIGRASVNRGLRLLPPHHLCYSPSSFLRDCLLGKDASHLSPSCERLLKTMV